MPNENIEKAAQAIDEIDKIISKYKEVLQPHEFDAVLSYLKTKYMQGL